MTKRATLITQTLAPTLWAGWSPEPIAADASTRNYTRLRNVDGTCVILMDSDPATDATFDAFITVGAQLNALGFSAPKTLLLDQTNGIAVIEDLGRADFANWISGAPHDSVLLYTAATDLLAKLHKAEPIVAVDTLCPATAGTMVAEVIDWYAACDAHALASAISEAYDAITQGNPTLALRDVHAENMIWRPDKTGHARVGLLDYQDAILAPAGYDLMSLLRDVRRDIDPSLSSSLIARFAQQADLDLTAFTAQCACVAVQRNLRILGVFARLIHQDRKQKYAAFLPRVWSHIQTDLAHPALGHLASVVRKTLPKPTHSKLANML